MTSALAAVLLLAACSTGEPVSPLGSAAPVAESPSPAAVPAEISTIRFSGSAIEYVDTGGEVRDSVPLGDGIQSIVTGLTAALGVGASVTEVPEQCAAARTDYAWEGLTVSGWSPTELTIAVTGAQSGGLRMEVTGGYAVGDDVEAAVAALPATDVGRFDPSGADLYASFDTVGRSADGTSPVGAVGYVTGGELRTIVTPGQWSSFLC